MHRPMTLFPVEVRSRGDKNNDQGSENSVKVLFRLLVLLLLSKSNKKENRSFFSLHDLLLSIDSIVEMYLP